MESDALIYFLIFANLIALYFLIKQLKINKNENI